MTFPVGAVVLDLFGTLVAAPTPAARTTAASALARVIGCDIHAVDDYLLGTWRHRHDGTLPTLSDLAEHVVNAVDGPASAIEPVMRELSALAHDRVAPDTSVMRTLTVLGDMGLRIGVLSDASADIATTWPDGRLATIVDAVVFSCAAGCTKPDRRLYARITAALGVPPRHTLGVLRAFRTRDLLRSFL